MNNETSIVRSHQIAPLIQCIRGQRVIVDRDVAALYGVETRALIQAVKRNLERFGEDFMFRLRPEETAALRSQIVILKPGRGLHPKYPPTRSRNTARSWPRPSSTVRALSP